MPTYINKGRENNIRTNYRRFSQNRSARRCLAILMLILPMVPTFQQQQQQKKRFSFFVRAPFFFFEVLSSFIFDMEQGHRNRTCR